jgi:hypothetical protein
MGNEYAGIGIPENDIDFFTVELFDEILDTDASYPDTGADGIKAFLASPYCDFRTRAWLAGNALDFDGTRVDFWDFEFEETA